MPTENQLCYSYSPTNFVYTGAEEMHVDPLEKNKDGSDVYLLPANATLVEPPPATENVAYVWNAANQEWVETPDYRGQTAYSTTDYVPIKISDIGAVPSGYTLLSPEGVQYPKWDGSKWVVDTDKQAAAAKAILTAQAQAMLDKTDIVVLRCFEAGVEVPADWKALRATLRNIVKTGVGTLPDYLTDYPEGT